MKEKVLSIVLNNFKNDSRVLKENISLQNAGYTVQIVALWEEGVEEFETVQGIAVHRLKLKSRNWSKNKFIQLIKYLELAYKVIKLYKQNDIIHCNDLNTLPIGVILKLFFNKKAKILYDAHEYEINATPNESKKRIKIKYYLEKYLIKYVNKTITVSESIANEYVRLYNIKTPSLVLNTPFFTEVKKRDIFRKKFNIEENQTIFLYQGGLGIGRGIEILLETFKALDKRSVIIFMGYGSLDKNIILASKTYDTIFFHEAVSPTVLLDYTASADVGISTIEDTCLSYKYCLPNKMFEYLMAEIPMIVSNLPEMKQMIIDNHIGVVAKDNTPEGLKEAIIKAVKLDKNILKQNILKVKKIYNWEEQEKVLLACYKEL